MNKGIVIYGGGFCGLAFCDMLIKNNIYPIAILDQDPKKKGIIWRGIVEIKLPDEQFVEDAIVIVCCVEKGNLFSEIKKKLEIIGYRNIIHISDYANENESEKIFETQKIILRRRNNIVEKNDKSYREVINLLCDIKSKEIYEQILEQLAGNNIEIDSLPMKQQYFSYELYKKNEKEVFVDVGAHNGCVMNTFLANMKGKYKEYHAFDVDDRYIAILKAQVAMHSDEKQQKIVIHDFGLSDCEQKVKFTNYLDSNSVIDDFGERTGRCEMLDHLSIPVTFMKIDVEGYEEKVIEGARKHILKYQPLIACAMYHNEKELFKIPIKLHELLPKHKLVIRSYMNINETICYAIPEERCLV